MKITCPKCGELGNLEEHFVKVKEESGGKRKEYGYWRVVHYIKEGVGGRGYATSAQSIETTCTLRRSTSSA
jgi:hypothetical protein